MLSRMMRAARLEVSLYEEVEADTGATFEAMRVVVLVALATGIGTLGQGGGSWDLLFGVIIGLLVWVIWAYLIYIIGTTFFRTSETDADWGQLARTTGFAQSPGILLFLGFIPVVGLAIIIVVSLWQFAAMVVAVRQALDFTSTWRALGVVLVARIPMAVASSFLFASQTSQ